MGASVTDVKHPAKYSPAILSEMERFIRIEAFHKNKRLRRVRTLDPLAGTGRVHELPGVTVGLEIEPEWAEMHPGTLLGDATKMPWRKNHFDVIAVSPTYGNRFSDSHNARDGSTRRSYTHDIGHRLAKTNTGQFPFRNTQRRDAPYRVLHKQSWAESARVLRPSGLFLLNVKNFFVGDEEQRVSEWHMIELGILGFKVEEIRFVPTLGLRYGANRKRTKGEYVISLRGPA
jgi:hypothetical protein